MAKLVLTDTKSGYNLAAINDNFDKIVDAVNNKSLSRSNPTGDSNQMAVPLDMNGQRIINLPAPISVNEPARVQDLLNATLGTLPTLPASFVTSTPGHTIAATNVQSALYELADDTVALTASLATETTARTTAVSNEATTRAANDATLQTNINTVSSTVSGNTTQINILIADRISNEFVVSNISALRGLDKTKHQCATTLGYYAGGDGGSGSYYCDLSDTTSADNFGSVIVATDGGRWKLTQNQDTSIKQWGAVVGGTTDAAGSIINALANLTTGSALRIDGGTYRCSVGITIPAGIAVYSSSLSHTSSTTGSTLLFDVGVATCVSMLGGAGGGQGRMKGITVQRGAGTIGAGSIGILVGSNSQMAVLEDCYVFRSNIGFSIDGSLVGANLGVKLTRCGTGQITGRHVQLAKSVETTFTECRFGRNGGGDFACLNYIAVVGTQVDTVHFIGCQFNQSGGTVNTLLQFYGYAADPNGIITFDTCHVEGIGNGGQFVVADASSTPIQRLRFCNSSLNMTGAFFSITAGTLFEFMLTGNTIDGGVSMTLDQQSQSVVTGNIWGGGAILINAGNQIITGNYFGGAVTLQGASSRTLFTGNGVAGGLANTMTGTTSIANNI